jgi:asparagine synthetase B (glutamine-hydrolysing)
MPGLKIVIGPAPSSRPRSEADRLASDVPLERVEVFTGPRTEVLFEAPPHHPRLAGSGPGFTFFLEGVVYDRSDEEVRDFAASLAQAALAGGSVADAVRGFVTGTDGVYVFVLVLGGGARVIAFNDAWGRLPLYAAQLPSVFLLGREPVDLLPHLPEIRLDRQAIAEWLVFEYTLNPEWFLQGLVQVQPATLFDVEVFDGDVRVSSTTLVPQDFTVTDPVRERREGARRYSELFLEALAARVTRLRDMGYRLTCDLSGGFDTRYVFAGALRLGAPMEFYTDELVTGDESVAAMRLAEIGGVPVTRVAQGPAITDEAEWRRLVYLTGGRINYTTTVGAVLLARARRKVVDGRAARFMGYAGEFVRHPAVRPYGYRSFQDAVADDVYTRYVKIGEAGRLVGLDPAAVRRRLAGAVEGWNERNDTDRARRLYFQYWYALAQIGEDRHRWHFWTVTPLVASHVLDFVYHRLDPAAPGYAFFVELLRTVDARTLAAPVHQNPTRLTSRRQVWTYSVKEDLRARLRNTRHYRHLRRRLALREHWLTPPSVEQFDWYRRQFDDAFRESAAVRSVFDESAVRAWVHPGQVTQRMNHLLTSVFLVSEVGRRFPGASAGA